MSQIHDLWVAGQDFQRPPEITSDGEHGTGLLEALLREDRDAVQALLVAGAAIGLREAALLGDAVRVRNLLGEGIDPSAFPGWSPLHLAAWGGHPEAVRSLVDAGLPVNLKARIRNPPSNATPLHLAVVRRHRAVVDTLLSLGADPNRRDDAFWSPLHQAAELGDLPLVKRLLEAGARPGARVAGHTPADMARRKGHKQVAAMLCAMDQTTV